MLKNKNFIILFIVILLLSLPTVVNAAKIATEKTKTSTGIEVEWSYDLSSETITNLKCTNVAAVTGALTIPETIDGYKVTSLGNDAFAKCYGLSEIIIPSGVTSLGHRCFNNCTGLTNITIPTGVTSIESYCFADCTGLTKITIPDGVTTLGNGIFSNCKGLPSIKIPNTVTSLGASAFDGCSSLANVTLSDKLTEIKSQTFANCMSLVEIVLPNKLTTISGNYSWDGAFDGCASLKWVKIPSNVAYIFERTFENCKNVTIYSEEGSYAQTFAESKNIHFEKAENWENRKEAQVAPKITKITAKGGEHEYISGEWEYQAKAGDEISVAIQFDKEIVLKESPTLTIKFGTGNNKELTTGIVSSDTITYRYVIKSEDIGAIQLVSLTGGDVTSNNGIQINNKLINLDNKLISINTGDEKVSVEAISLNSTTLSLDKGDIHILKATVKPTNATNKSVTFTSSDEKIAAVNSEGKITAIAKGKATITVTTVDGAKTATCEVTVTEPIKIEDDKTSNNNTNVENNGTSGNNTTQKEETETNKGNNAATNKDTEANKNNNKVDNTVSKIELPKTGKLAGTMAIVVLTTLMVLGYIKYRQYKEI